MRTPDLVVERLRLAWDRRWSTWLGGGGEWPFAVPLDVPTQAEAAAQWARFTAWIASWRAYTGPGTVRWSDRVWTRMGKQSIPTHVDFDSAEAIARELGPALASEYARCDARFRGHVAAVPQAEAALRGHAAWLISLSEPDAARAEAVLDWLAAHPGCGLYPRQLPIEGVDTKWLERHSGPIAALLAARLGVERAPLATVAGLAVDPPRRRLRLLCAQLRARVGGFGDLSVRLDELTTVELGARVALIVENQQSALACEDLEGAVVIVGGGFSVTEFAQVPWLHRIPVVYWGDIDAAGFQILAALRTHLPHVHSCLMDEATLLAHRPLWTVDPAPVRVQALPTLTADESAVYAGLVNGTWGLGVRLEQERIPWAHAWGMLNATASLEIGNAGPNYRRAYALSN